MNAFTARIAAYLQALWATRDEGATAVEYGLLVALIAAVIVTIVATLGTQVAAGFTKVSAELTKALP